MSVYAVPTPQPFIGENIKTKRKKSQIDRNAELLRNPDVRFEILNYTLQIREVAEIDQKEIEEMAKANIVEKHSLSMKGILNIDDEGKVFIETEDGDALEVATLLEKFNGSAVTISVGESIDIA